MILYQLVLALFCAVAILDPGTGFCESNARHGKSPRRHLRLPAVRALAGNAQLKNERAGYSTVDTEAKAIAGAECVFQFEQRFDCQPDREKSQSLHEFTVQYATRTLNDAFILLALNYDHRNSTSRMNASVRDLQILHTIR